MDMPPVVGEWIDKNRRVHWVFRARHAVTLADMQATIEEHLRDKGEPPPNKRIDVLMNPASEG